MSGLEELSRAELIALAHALATDNARKDAEIARRSAEIDRLTRHLSVLEKENAELRERVARLERLISRNSGNSGMPPGSDDQPGRPQPKDKARQGGKRRPGKQPGAPGTSLAWADDPDDIIDHFPVGVCGCGADLAGAADLGVTARH